MKNRSKQEKEARRMASPNPADRFTDREEEAMYTQGYRALRRQLAAEGRSAPEHELPANDIPQRRSVPFAEVEARLLARGIVTTEGLEQAQRKLDADPAIRRARRGLGPFVVKKLPRRRK